jgi:hypothetical protein
MHEPHYLLVDGTLRYVGTDGRAGHPLVDGLGLLFDRAEGLLLKHGSTPAIQRHFDRYVSALAGISLVQDLAFLSIDLDSVTPALVEDVNRSIQISGYILYLAQQLGSGAEPPSPQPG